MFGQICTTDSLKNQEIHCVHKVYSGVVGRFVIISRISLTAFSDDSDGDMYKHVGYIAKFLHII